METIPRGYGNYRDYPVNKDYPASCKVKEYEKPYFAGMQTRYPDCLSTTFTLGNNGLEITNPDKLIRLIVKEIETK